MLRRIKSSFLTPNEKKNLSVNDLDATVTENGQSSESNDISKEVVLVLVSADQIILFNFEREEELESVVDNLDATENGESSEETHCATYQTKS